MSTDTDFHLSNCNNSWSLSENQNPSQALSVSGKLDHGSISFGRSAAESLEWGKWSVFSHNKCQEELEKFKAPGFVAQKKAYFEEYYRRIRAMKASQAEQQETIGLDLNQDFKSHEATQAETGVDDAMSKGDRKSGYARKIQILDDDSSVNSNSSWESIVQKQEPVTKELLSKNNERASIISDAVSEFLCASEIDQPTKETSCSHTRVTRSSDIAHHESLVSNSVNLIASKPKTQGNVASARNRSKSQSRSREEGIKLSDKKKLSPQEKITEKGESRIVVGKSSKSKAATGHSLIHVSSPKRLTEACCSSTTPSASSARNRLEPSSSSGKTSQKKLVNSTGRGLANRLPRSRPGYRQSAQSSLKETVSGGLEQKGTDNSNKNAHLFGLRLTVPGYCADSRCRAGGNKTRKRCGGQFNLKIMQGSFE
ncbi:hypothetical protein PanWU01x14_096570 [Parasponia andersonii]|uniref:Protein WVD2-like 7 n=1 Tax=Parasponia andersonii TaxID=3476 RepID=A0A2P5D4Y1_PARAD|nr:hypothetical protein PanWU01x14_096570 [Parasponia andersonii]